MKILRSNIEKLVILLFTILVGISLLCAIRSSNLLLGAVSARIFILPVMIVILSIVIKKIPICYKLSRSLIVATIVFLLLIFLQLRMVLATHPNIGFDVGAFYNYISLNHVKETRGYFSMYPNNLLLLLLQKSYLTMIGKINEYYLALDKLNVLLVDISAMLNIATAYIYNKKYLIKGIWINILWLLLFPMIIVPYSDTTVIPFVSLLIFIYVLMRQSEKFYLRCVCAILMGIIVSIIYFIKPSSVIPFIAIVIMTIIFLKNINWQKATLGVLCIFSLSVTYIGTNKFIHTQDYIKIDDSRRIPMIHFIDMGMGGDRGAYNVYSVEAMNSLNKKQRISYSKEHIKQTLRERGPLGYVKFLLTKQGYNTADGTFGWLQEGNFITASAKDNPNIFKDYLYPDGEYLSDFKFIAQLVWIVGLGILLLGFNDKRFIVQVLRLALIGGFIFLLLFEGGRSRYMIQFLPVVLVLVTVLYDTAILNLKNIVKALFGKTQ